MAKPTLAVIQALRETAHRLSLASNYQWGHMGSCNCGFLVQVVTERNPVEIHQAAMQGTGDWSEQLNDYCPSSGFAIDLLITQLVQFGFEVDDLSHLERLSHASVLATPYVQGRQLNHNVKADVVVYLKAWALLLEDQLISTLPDLPEFTSDECLKSFPAKAI